VALLAAVVLLSSIAEESCENDDKDQDSDCDSDDDVKSAVVAGCGGDGLNVPVFINGQSFACAIINFSSSSVADALLGSVKVQHARTITAVSATLIVGINFEDSFQSTFKSGLSFNSTSATSSCSASDSGAGTNTDVNFHVNFEGETA